MKFGISVLLTVDLFLPLPPPNIRHQNLPILIQNTIYRMKYSVDLNFPRQHRKFLEESVNRVAMSLVAFVNVSL